MTISNHHHHQHPPHASPPKTDSSQQRLLIKGGRIVNDDGTTLADVFIEEGVIKQIGHNLIVPGGTKTIDATGKLVMPGGIDTNTHLESTIMGTKSVDDFMTGTRAAIVGGTTTIRTYKRCINTSNRQ